MNTNNETRMANEHATAMAAIAKALADIKILQASLADTADLNWGQVTTAQSVAFKLRELTHDTDGTPLYTALGAN